VQGPPPTESGIFPTPPIFWLSALELYLASWGFPFLLRIFPAFSSPLFSQLSLALQVAHKSFDFPTEGMALDGMYVGAVTDVVTHEERP